MKVTIEDEAKAVAVAPDEPSDEQYAQDWYDDLELDGAEGAAKAAREFSDKTRKRMAASGVAMPGGGYPIPDVNALKRAIRAIGRAKDRAATIAHIVKRARALGAASLIPKGWASAKGSMAAGHASAGADVLEGLYCLIDAEADEPQQAQLLRNAADAVLRWMGMEAQEIGQPGDDADEGVGKAGGVFDKTLVEMKAEPLSVGDYDRWLKGDISRRMLVLPYGGPILAAHAPNGVDIDFEFFHEGTDHIGPFPRLKATRDRLVDFHHDEMLRKMGNVGDPTGVMKGAILGRVVLDDHPESVDVDGIIASGIWGDFWRKQGEERARLVAEYEKRGVKFYGSTQPVQKAILKTMVGYDDKWGKPIRRIDVWPIDRHTVSTSPQNTLAVMPPLKALLTADLPFEDVGLAALKAALVGIEDLGADLRATFPGRGGERAAKARRLSEALDEAERTLRRITAYTGTHTES